MLAIAAPVPFKQVVDFLHTRMLPTLREVFNKLDSYRKRARAAVILFELDPEKFKRVNAEKETVTTEWDEDPIVEACLEEINAIAPLDMELMAMRFEEGEYIDSLYPAACGYPLGWDEWEEMVDNLDTTNVEISLSVFTIAMRLGDGNVLFTASEHYGWDLEIEEIESLPDPNWDRLYELLDQHAMGHFKNAIDACLYSTGNPYFDYNPREEGQIYDLPAFTLEGVRALEECWQEAQPISKDLTAAVAQFASDPALAQVLLMLYVESQDEPEHRPQTLAEMWAGEGQEEQLVDPFYGPIGLAAEDDDEEENE